MSHGLCRESLSIGGLRPPTGGAATTRHACPTLSYTTIVLLAAVLQCTAGLDPEALRQQLAVQESRGSPMASQQPLAPLPAQFDTPALPPAPVTDSQFQGLQPPLPVDPSEPLFPEEQPSPLQPPNMLPQPLAGLEGPSASGSDASVAPALALSAQQSLMTGGRGHQPLPARGENPLLSLYRRDTLQYKEDAEEANKAAAMYAQMTKEAVQSGQVASMAQSLGGAEMNRIGVGTWAHAAWEFEKLLRDNTAALQSKAAKEAKAPFVKAEGEYLAAQDSYDVAAQDYGTKVAENQQFANAFQTYANQYRLEGDEETAEKYENEVAQLNGQSENLANLARAYYTKAVKINNLIPRITKWGKAAAKFAKFTVANKNPIGKEHLFPFTIMPPIALVQTGEELQQASEMPHTAANRAFRGR